MIVAASLVAVVVVSLLITRVATVALTLTGMSRESARFQARSALSGVGFTTSEAESVVKHPIRRRVVMLLMLLGSAGIVTVVATFVLSFANTDVAQKGQRVAFVVGGLLVLWLLARNAWVDARLSRSRSDGRFLGAPRFDTVVIAGDTLLVYGLVDRIAELDRRSRGDAGDRMHDVAVAEHARLAQKELDRDRRRAPSAPRSDRGDGSVPRRREDRRLR